MQIANEVRPSRNRTKKAADILKYFEDPFWGCTAADMVFSELAADRL